MTTKVKAEKAEEIVQPPFPNADCHHIFYSVGVHPQQGKSISGFEANEKLNIWLRAGYKVKTAQAMSIEPGVVNVFVLLVKDEPT